MLTGAEIGVHPGYCYDRQWQLFCVQVVLGKPIAERSWQKAALQHQALHRNVRCHNEHGRVGRKEMLSDIDHPWSFFQRRIVSEDATPESRKAVADQLDSASAAARCMNEGDYEDALQLLEPLVATGPDAASEVQSCVHHAQLDPLHTGSVCRCMPVRAPHNNSTLCNTIVAHSITSC